MTAARERVLQAERCTAAPSKAINVACCELPGCLFVNEDCVSMAVFTYTEAEAVAERIHDIVWPINILIIWIEPIGGVERQRMTIATTKVIGATAVESQYGYTLLVALSINGSTPRDF